MLGMAIAFPEDQQSYDVEDGEIYLAGERVAPGIYRQIGSGREVYLEHEDVLPASMDGRVACYEHVQHTWKQVQRRQTEQA